MCIGGFRYTLHSVVRVVSWIFEIVPVYHEDIFISSGFSDGGFEASSDGVSIRLSPLVVVNDDFYTAVRGVVWGFGFTPEPGDQVPGPEGGIVIGFGFPEAIFGSMSGAIFGATFGARSGARFGATSGARFGGIEYARTFG